MRHEAIAAIAALVAASMAACHRKPVAQRDSRGDGESVQMDEQSSTAANDSNPAARYRAYLASMGYAEPGHRAVELSALSFRDVRFFAYNEGGLRLKLAVTRAGIVRLGAHSGDDWSGLLSAAPDAMTVAERIAWLETDESTPVHGLPSSPVVALAPDRRPAVAIDPAHWALVTTPTLQKSPDGSATLVAWLLPSGARVPVRWTVTAPPAVPASITRVAAADVLAAQGGGSAADTAVRARRLLASGTADERRWALLHIRETGDRAAVDGVAALLANQGAPPEIRLLAAGTLAALADPAAVAPLGTALRTDPASEVRRAAAQALGRLHGAPSIQALSAAAPHEQDVAVRIEIVHALSAQGSPARAALGRIARSDADASVRTLARGYADALP